MPAGRAISEDERGLLRGVLASPEDLTARLVYADWLDEHDDPRGPWLRAVCEQQAATSAGDEPRANAASAAALKLRAKLDPDWAALFDGGSHYTVLLTAEIVNNFRATVQAGQPLPCLNSWVTSQSDFRSARVKPGDHVYPVQLVSGQILVLTRFRVAALRNRDKPFAPGEFVPSGVHEYFRLHMPSYIQVLDVADGGVLRYDRVLPRPLLERLHYATRRGERGLSSLKDGRLTNITTVHGVFELAPGSARDFGLLVFAPELLDNFAPLPPPPSGKKRK